MAKVHNNIFVRGLTGSVGDQFVIRKTRSGRTIIANKPTFDQNREFSDSQKAQQAAFREATTYAKSAQTHPLYEQKVFGTDLSAYNLAVADFFIRPEVLDIDISNLKGQAGESIRIKAQDDVLVVNVQVVIRQGTTVLEEGEAIQSETDGLLWIYSTQTAVPLAPGLQVEAIAADLPGHKGSSSTIIE